MGKINNFDDLEDRRSSKKCDLEDQDQIVILKINQNHFAFGTQKKTWVG